MSRISRPAAYSIVAGRAQAAPLAQRHRSWALLISPLQLRQASGSGTSCAPAGRSPATAAWTRGMMSPGFIDSPLSPKWRSRRRMPAGLCSVARVTVEPSISTALRDRVGARNPVRPNSHTTSCSTVCRSIAGSLTAMAQYGDRVLMPADCCSAVSFSLTTTLLIPTVSAARIEAMVSTLACAFRKVRPRP